MDIGDVCAMTPWVSFFIWNHPLFAVVDMAKGITSLPVANILKHAIILFLLQVTIHHSYLASCSLVFTVRPSWCQFRSSVILYSYVSSASEHRSPCPAVCGLWASWIDELQVMSEKKGPLCSQQLEYFPYPFRKTPSSHLLCLVKSSIKALWITLTEKCGGKKIKCNRMRPSCEACKVFQCPCIYGRHSPCFASTRGKYYLRDVW